jgi:hypothetical protein
MSPASIHYVAEGLDRDTTYDTSHAAPPSLEDPQWNLHHGRHYSPSAGAMQPLPEEILNRLIPPAQPPRRETTAKADPKAISLHPVRTHFFRDNPQITPATWFAEPFSPV